MPYKLCHKERCTGMYQVCKKYCIGIIAFILVAAIVAGYFMIRESTSAHPRTPHPSPVSARFINLLMRLCTHAQNTKARKLI